MHAEQMMKAAFAAALRRDKTRQLFAEALVLAQADVADADVGAAAADVEGAMHRSRLASLQLLGMRLLLCSRGVKCSPAIRRQRGALCHGIWRT